MVVCCCMRLCGVYRQLKVQVLHDSPYGRRMPGVRGGPPSQQQQQQQERGLLGFSVPKQNPTQHAAVNIAVSFHHVGEAAFLYNANSVGIWRAEDARVNTRKNTQHLNCTDT